MSFVERDLLRRLLQDFARMLAAIVGLRRRGDYQAADLELTAYIDALLGRLARDAERLESESLARLLKTERLVHYAILVAERGNLRAAQGDPVAAELDRARALELLLEARARATPTGAEPLIEELLGEPGVRRLGARYRELLGMYVRHGQDPPAFGIGMKRTQIRPVFLVLMREGARANLQLAAFSSRARGRFVT